LLADKMSLAPLSTSYSAPSTSILIQLTCFIPFERQALLT
jgi:hypothetical protein